MNWHVQWCCPSYNAVSLYQVWTKSISRCPSYGPKCVYTQDGHQGAILNDIKNLFDVHNPQTTPDLGVKFQTIWPTCTLLRNRCPRTYIRRPTEVKQAQIQGGQGGLAPPPQKIAPPNSQARILTKSWIRLCQNRISPRPCGWGLKTQGIVSSTLEPYFFGQNRSCKYKTCVFFSR